MGYLAWDDNAKKYNILFTVFWHRKDDSPYTFNIHYINGDTAHEANRLARTLVQSGECDRVTVSNSKTGRTKKFA